MTRAELIKPYSSGTCYEMRSFSQHRLVASENRKIFISTRFLIFLACTPVTICADQFMGSEFWRVLCGWPIKSSRILQKEIKCYTAIHKTLIIRWSASLVCPRCSLACFPQGTRLASFANESSSTHNYSLVDLVARAGPLFTLFLITIC